MPSLQRHRAGCSQAIERTNLIEACTGTPLWGWTIPPDDGRPTLRAEECPVLSDSQSTRSAQGGSARFRDHEVLAARSILSPPAPDASSALWIRIEPRPVRIV